MCQTTVLFLSVFAVCTVSLHPQENKSLVIVSSCNTSVQDQEENVKKNIFLASRAVNNYTIAPNAVFSFNDVVGEANERNGYVNGKVLYQGEVRYESGGGVCQVSSTLYNALLLSGCTIVQRSRHYRPVTYVPPGLDATIRYGEKDLKMKNPHPHPLIIEAKLTGSSLVMVIRSPAPLPFTYELETEEDDVDVPLADNSANIRKGLNISVFRKKMKGNTVLQSQLLYRDYYPPVYAK